MTILSIPGRTHENPYFKHFCDSLADAGLELAHIRQRAAFLFAFDILHVHFPTHFITESGPFASYLWALCEVSFFVICFALGKPIIYTVHDVQQMNLNNTWILKRFLKIFYRLCAGYVFLSSSSRDEFFGLFPDQSKKPWIQIPHGPYPARIQNPEEREKTRRRFITNETDFLVGFLGSIKQYKNLGVLAVLPRFIAGGRKLRVVVAGQIEDQYKEEAVSILSHIPADMLTRIDKRLSDEELDDIFQACDVVLLPYQKGWNSGAAMLALSNRVRLLASKLPIFRELEATLPYWTTTFVTDHAEVKVTLCRALETIAATKGGPKEEERLTAFLNNRDFLRGAQAVKEFYQQVRTKTYLPSYPQGTPFES